MSFPLSGQLVVLRFQQANLWDSLITLWPIRTHGSAHSISVIKFWPITRRRLVHSILPRFDHQFLTNHKSRLSSLKFTQNWPSVPDQSELRIQLQPISMHGSDIKFWPITDHGSVHHQQKCLIWDHHQQKCLIFWYKRRASHPLPTSSTQANPERNHHLTHSTSTSTDINISTSSLLLAEA
jgi:hypothetical protein